jgi:hypothetical protein
MQVDAHDPARLPRLGSQRSRRKYIEHVLAGTPPTTAAAADLPDVPPGDQRISTRPSAR